MEKQKVTGGTAENADAGVETDVMVDPAALARAARASVATGLAQLAAELMEDGRDLRQRAIWLKIGRRLLWARDSFEGSTKAFGAWIETSGISKIPGIRSAGTRSDAIWCAEFPERTALIPPGITNPRAIRTAWRMLYTERISCAATALIAEVGVPQVPDIAAAAASIVTDTHSDADNAFRDLEKCILGRLDGSQDAMKKERGLAALQEAMLQAKACGIAPIDICASATVVWGGCFAWSPMPKGKK